MGFFLTVPTEPPPSRVPAVDRRREIIERELVDLKQQVDERVLACAEGKPDAWKNLADLCAKIRVAEFEIDGLAPARDLAARLDDHALMAWRAEVQTLSPSEIIAGITKDDCCDRCTNGCVILGADPSADRNECAHPMRFGFYGPLAARYADNPQVQAVHAAACAKLRVGTFETPREEDIVA